MVIILRWKKLQLYAWNWHFKKFLPKELDVLRWDFWGFGCPNDAQTPCWLCICPGWLSLRLCSSPQKQWAMFNEEGHGLSQDLETGHPKWTIMKFWAVLFRMLEIMILRNNLGVLRWDIWGSGCPNDAQRPCWLRLYLRLGSTPHKQGAMCHEGTPLWSREREEEPQRLHLEGAPPTEIPSTI